MGTGAFEFRRFDGTGLVPPVDPDQVLSEMADDLLEHGDAEAALRRLLSEGFRRRDGSRAPGARELAQRLARMRQALLSRADPSGVLAELDEELGAIVDDERSRVSDLLEGSSPVDERGGEELPDGQLSRETLQERWSELELLPVDPASRLRALRGYEFVSDSARERYQALLERLANDVVGARLGQSAARLSAMSEAERARLREALHSLNDLLERALAGEDTQADFEAWKARFGDLFGELPERVEDLATELATSSAAFSSLLGSLSADQRAGLEAAMAAALGDDGLLDELQRLSSNLARAVPDAGWGMEWELSGEGAASLGEATASLEQLGVADRLESLLRSGRLAEALADVDLDEVRRVLGDEVADALGELAEVVSELERSGLLQRREGRLELGAKGLRRIGERVLDEVFRQLDFDRLGGHRARGRGSGHEPDGTSRPLQPGDPMDLHLGRTLENALRRGGPGLPVRLALEDLELVVTEPETRSSVVLALDLSLSMPMADRFLPAKKLALALATLLHARFPHDYLGLIGFSEVARPITVAELPAISWDYVYGTNLAHALALGRRMLAGRPGNRQLLVVTDGEPTAHLDASGEVFFSYPPAPETLARTLGEVMACTRAKIRLSVFALDPSRSVRRFVERIAEVNRGQAVFASADELGVYVISDFLTHRSSVVGR